MHGSSGILPRGTGNSERFNTGPGHVSVLVLGSVANTDGAHGLSIHYQRNATAQRSLLGLAADRQRKRYAKILLTVIHDGPSRLATNGGALRR